MENISHYGQWGTVLITLTIFSWFIFSFLKPKKKIDWRNSGIFGAFLVALYAEMYGFPLTIYILSSIFGIDIPFTHIKGHLWATLLGLGETGAMVEMMIGYFVIITGGILIIVGWKKIYGAKGDISNKARYRTKDELVTGGIYKYMRHPQYTGIILVTLGMLIHWPTLITLLMWPVLILAYYGLAKREEKEMKRKFGEVYQKYKNKVPMFLPRLKSFVVKIKQK